MSTQSTLRTTIRDRRPVALAYDGGDPRTVHPHVLYGTTTGRLCVAAYQVAGPTSSGTPLPAWRQFDLTRITALDVLDGRFDIAPDFNPDAARYRQQLLAIVAE